MSLLYGGNWDEYRASMCICPKCGKDEITLCICDEEETIGEEPRVESDKIIDKE